METAAFERNEAVPAAPARRASRLPWMGWALAAAVLLIGFAAPAAVRRAKLSLELNAARDALRDAEPLLAIEHLEPLVQSHPELAEAHYLLAVAYRRNGQLAKVVDLLKRAGELGWSRRDIKRQQYLTVFLQGYIEQAEPYLKTLLADEASDDEAAEVYEAFVKGYLSELRFKEADLCIQYWTQWRPEDPQPRLWRAELAHVLTDTVREQAEYRAILKAHPDHFLARSRLAQALVRTNAVEEAYKHFKICAEARPEDGMVMVGLAECEQRMTQPKKARETIKRALQRPLTNDQEAFAYATLGEFELQLLNYPAAVEALKKSVELSPRDSTTLFSLGRALSLVGKKAEAERYMERSRELRNYDIRMSDLSREIIDHPDNADLRARAGAMLLAEKQYTEALIWLASAIRLNPAHAGAHESLAEYYEQQGDAAQAQQHRMAAASAAAEAFSLPEGMAPEAVSSGGSGSGLANGVSKDGVSSDGDSAEGVSGQRTDASPSEGPDGPAERRARLTSPESGMP